MTMTDETVGTSSGEATSNGRNNPVFELVRKVALASVGAVVLAQDELEELINRLVERGEIAERDGRNLISDLVEKRKTATKESFQSVGTEVDGTIERVLHRVNIPTKTDIQSLTAKIDEIGRRLDELVGR